MELTCIIIMMLELTAIHARKVEKPGKFEVISIKLDSEVLYYPRYSMWERGNYTCFITEKNMAPRALLLVLPHWR